VKVFKRVLFQLQLQKCMDSKYNMLASDLDRKSVDFLLYFNHGLLLGETIDVGRLLSADLTALFTNNADTDRVICWVSAIMLCKMRNNESGQFR